MRRSLTPPCTRPPRPSFPRRRCFSASAARKTWPPRTLHSFLRQHKPSQAAIDYFSSIPWARETIEDDGYRAIPMFSRHLDRDTGQSRFLPTVLGTDGTIRHLLALRQKLTSTPTCIRPHDVKQASRRIRKHRPQFICLMSLGQEPGSQPSIVPEDFQCVVLDEVFHHLILLRDENIKFLWQGTTHVAASMNTRHPVPLLSPGDILVRAWVVWRWHGAWFCRAEIINSEGVVTTTADAKWVRLKLDGSSTAEMDEPEAAELEELEAAYAEELVVAFFDTGAVAKELKAIAKELKAIYRELLKAIDKQLKAIDKQLLKAAPKALPPLVMTKSGSILTTGEESPGIVVNRRMWAQFRKNRLAVLAGTRDGLSKSVLTDRMKSMYKKRDYHRGVY